MTAFALAIRYAAFAIVATIANVVTQRLVFFAAESGSGRSGTLTYWLAISAGTLIGLLIKYVLDKRWIFEDRSYGLHAHGKRFTLYTLMGVATTLIFWGTETGFWMIWGTQLARETGAAIGLSIGYFVKYRLDRWIVFNREDERNWSPVP